MDKITTINYHLTKICNFQCKYCFSIFDEVKYQLHEEGSYRLMDLLGASGLFNKINFSGGEPMLVPYMDKLIMKAKEYGMKTSMVTNASLLNAKWINDIAPFLNIIAISIDSLRNDVNKRVGRGTNIAHIKEMVNVIKSCGIQLKINTVVSNFNKEEIVSPLIEELEPFRWKILQATKINEQNDSRFIEISSNEFDHFCEINKMSTSLVEVIREPENLIIGSYCMIDPMGRFFDNSKSRHSYSEPILQIGVNKALSQITNSVEKFNERKGIY